MCPKSSFIFRSAAVGYEKLEARLSFERPALLDLRFADDILLFAKSYAETVSFLHDLVTALSQVGLILNASKTVVLTNEAQPPQHLQLPSRERIAILEHNSSQKWLGCIVTAQSSKLYHVATAAGVQGIFR